MFTENPNFFKEPPRGQEAWSNWDVALPFLGAVIAVVVLAVVLKIVADRRMRRRNKRPKPGKG